MGGGVGPSNYNLNLLVLDRQIRFELDIGFALTVPGCWVIGNALIYFWLELESFTYDNDYI